MLDLTYNNFLKLLNECSSPEKLKLYDINTTAVLKKIQEGGNKIYIWPAGKIGRRMYEELSNKGYSNLMLVDQTEVPGTIAPNSIEFDSNDVLIISTITYSNEIFNKGLAMKCNNIIMYYKVKELLEPVTFPEDFYDICFESLPIHLIENIERYKDMYNSLADNKSKENFLSNMFFRLTSDVRYTFGYDTKIQYFCDFIKYHEEDVYIDGGGFNGDTLSQFLELNKPFQAYYLFEPDENLLEQAKNVSNDSRVNYVNKGLFSASRSLRFTKTITNDGDGRIGGNGTEIVDVVSIDDYFSSKNVTFIKMDIEGAELEALKGAENIIKRCSPTLAICIYHKPSDYLDIYEYIKSLNPSYHFYIRHHKDYYADTVLYAVAKDRVINQL